MTRNSQQTNEVKDIPCVCKVTKYKSIWCSHGPISCAVGLRSVCQAQRSVLRDQGAEELGLHLKTPEYRCGEFRPCSINREFPKRICICTKGCVRFNQHAEKKYDRLLLLLQPPLKCSIQKTEIEE